MILQVPFMVIEVNLIRGIPIHPISWYYVLIQRLPFPMAASGLLQENLALAPGKLYTFVLHNGNPVFH